MVKIRSLVVWGNRPTPKKAPILHRIDMGIEEEHLYTMVGIGEKAVIISVFGNSRFSHFLHFQDTVQPHNQHGKSIFGRKRGKNMGIV